MQGVTVYGPAMSVVPPLVPYIRSLWARRQLTWHLSRSELKAEHFDTVLGQVWLVLDPLIMAAVYLLIRAVLRPIGSAEERWALIADLIMSVFFFHFTSRTLNSGARSLLRNQRMILNASVPVGVYPLASVLKGFLDFVPTVLVYFVIHAALGQPFGLGMVTLPLFIVFQTLFTYGCVLFFAPQTVFYRDAAELLPYMTRIWLFATPVLYRVSEIPPNLDILKLNPLYPFFAAYEQIFDGRWPSLVYVVATGAWAVVTIVAGGWLFLRREREVAVRL
jgi:teichoic acid transport system permease protein